jgi:hypothetical protein
MKRDGEGVAGAAGQVDGRQWHAPGHVSKDMPHGSRLMVHGSWLAAHGARLMAHGSRLMIHGRW